MTTPVFNPPSTNPYGLVSVGSAKPVFADINGDGTLDAIIGNNSGNSLVFLNTGTTTAPVFAAPLTNPYNLADVGSYAAPTLADINGDGKLDAIIGNSAGNSLVFLNTGTATAPVFAAPLTNPYGLANVGNYAAPRLADINGDGTLDAIIGNGGGNSLVFLNTGTTTAPVFAAPLTNPYNLADVGSYAVPAIADINGDGTLDAIIGNDGGNSLVFLNTGTTTAPVFAAPLTNPYGLANVGSSAGPTFADINGDGKLDAIIGSGNGDSLVFLGGTTNISPTLTAFTGAVQGTLTNAAATITLANLLTQGNESDADGTVTGFVIQALSTGTLLIGATAATATPWGPANNIVDATHNAYWTPALNTVGTLNAFTAVAQDNLGAVSATPVQATVTVSALAAAATIASVDNTYIVHNTNINPDFTVNYAMGDQVVDTPNLGTDTVIADVSYALGANIENLILSGNAVTGVGNDLNNVITGNALDNLINGGGGANTLAGGAGNDYYFVSSSANVVVELPGQGSDVVFSTASNYTLSDNVEHLVIWGTGLNGTGNAGNNIIFGNALNNILADGAGADFLIGGLGKDTYNLSVDSSTDTLLISAGDSLTSSYDVVNNFNLGATGTDRLDLTTTQIAANAAAVGGAIAGSSITGASISNGIISFQGIGGAAIAATAVSLADAIAYVQANIIGGNTVAFVAGSDTFVFQDGGANDTLVDLVGVAATSISNTNTVAGGAVWIV